MAVLLPIRLAIEINDGNTLLSSSKGSGRGNFHQKSALFLKFRVFVTGLYKFGKKVIVIDRLNCLAIISVVLLTIAANS